MPKNAVRDPEEDDFVWCEECAQEAGHRVPYAIKLLKQSSDLFGKGKFYRCLKGHKIPVED